MKGVTAHLEKGPLGDFCSDLSSEATRDGSLVADDESPRLADGSGDGVDVPREQCLQVYQLAGHAVLTKEGEELVELPLSNKCRAIRGASCSTVLSGAAFAGLPSRRTRRPQKRRG